ncbi:FAD/NAD(P)-binding protein [Streptomyces gamaensis]|uniref:FAD/NAD(P)-binding protein n=1 Tax=Streptomyces gamaensis TaxID=1763542 RepID=A0ABW0Z636_9ACTN
MRDPVDTAGPVGRAPGGPGRDVVIVGGGTAGTSVLLHLVRELADRPPGRVRSVRVVDPCPAGWGLAFGERDPLLLCNSAADVNSLLADRPGDFVDHLRGRGWSGSGEDCVPRVRMAEYCADRFHRACEQAAALGVTVHQIPAAALSVGTGPGGPRVRLSTGEELRADAVVVATGVRRPRVPDGFAPFVAHPRYLDSPYPAARVRRRLRPASRVLVLGSRQSAVDAALLLCRDGHRVTLTSPSGTLPAVRVSLGAPARSFPSLERVARLDPADPLLEERLVRSVVEAVRLLSPLPLRRQVSRADDPLTRLREETALLEAGACAWPGAMVPLIEAFIELGAALDERRRAAVLDRFGWFTGRYVTAMTVVNARRLLAHADTGLLRVAPSYPRSVAFEGGRWRVAGAAPGDHGAYDHVVNATGFHPPTLCRSATGEALLLTDGPGPPGAACRLGDGLRVRRDARSAPEPVWVVGVGTHVRIPFANHLRSVVRQARRVAGELAG